MRTAGLGLVLFGGGDTCLPSYRRFVPHVPLSDVELRVSALMLIFFGALLVLLVRRA